MSSRKKQSIICSETIRNNFETSSNTQLEDLNIVHDHISALEVRSDRRQVLSRSDRDKSDHPQLFGTESLAPPTLCASNSTLCSLNFVPSSSSFHSFTSPPVSVSSTTAVEKSASKRKRRFTSSSSSSNTNSNHIPNESNFPSSSLTVTASFVPKAKKAKLHSRPRRSRRSRSTSSTSIATTISVSLVESDSEIETESLSEDLSEQFSQELLPKRLKRSKALKSGSIQKKARKSKFKGKSKAINSSSSKALDLVASNSASKQVRPRKRKNQSAESEAVHEGDTPKLEQSPSSSQTKEIETINSSSSSDTIIEGEISTSVHLSSQTNCQLSAQLSSCSSNSSSKFASQDSRSLLQGKNRSKSSQASGPNKSSSLSISNSSTRYPFRRTTVLSTIASANFTSTVKNRGSKPSQVATSKSLSSVTNSNTPVPTSSSYSSTAITGNRHARAANNSNSTRNSSASSGSLALGLNSSTSVVSGANSVSSLSSSHATAASASASAAQKPIKGILKSSRSRKGQGTSSSATDKPISLAPALGESASSVGGSSSMLNPSPKPTSSTTLMGQAQTSSASVPHSPTLSGSISTSSAPNTSALVASSLISAGGPHSPRGLLLPPSTSSASARVSAFTSKPPSSTASTSSGAGAGATTSKPPTSTAGPPGGLSSLQHPFFAISGLEGDERIHALLEAGVSKSMLAALRPGQLGQMLSRSFASSANRGSQFLQGLQSPDEGVQLTTLDELCQYLIMGNEDTLGGFPVHEFVPKLIDLLREPDPSKPPHRAPNYDVMEKACRAVVNLLEVLPRSAALLVQAQAIPVLLQKLQTIEVMDVAEQALSALETLSRRNYKAIRQAKGIEASLTYLEFFSMAAQRQALSIAAACCQHLTPTQADLALVEPSLPTLAAKLTQQDKKSVESACLCFTRMVHSFSSNPPLLNRIATHQLLMNTQHLLLASPPLVSAQTFADLLRMLVTLCTAAPDLGVSLLELHFNETLCFLLVGSSDPNVIAMQNNELISRSSSELHEILSLIAELMPKLPSDGIFSVDALVQRYIQLLSAPPLPTCSMPPPASFSRYALTLSASDQPPGATSGMLGSTTPAGTSILPSSTLTIGSGPGSGMGMVMGTGSGSSAPGTAITRPDMSTPFFASLSEPPEPFGLSLGFPQDHVPLGFPNFAPLPLGLASNERTSSVSLPTSQPTDPSNVLCTTGFGASLGTCRAGPGAPSALGIGVSWLWQNDSDEWLPYSPEHTIALEMAFQSGDDPTLSIAGRIYNFDLASHPMLQISDRGNERQIIRKMLRGTELEGTEFEQPAFESSTNLLAQVLRLSSPDDEAPSAIGATASDSEASQPFDSPTAPLTVPTSGSGIATLHSSETANTSPISSSGISNSTGEGSLLAPLSDSTTGAPPSGSGPQIMAKPGGTSDPSLLSNTTVSKRLLPNSGFVVATGANAQPVDPRARFLNENRDLAINFVQTLFPIALQVYNACSGSSVRYRCIQAQLRMLFFADRAYLTEVLRNLPISTHIASMLKQTNDLRSTIGALQMALVLLEKMPEIFTLQFRRQGVVFQVEKLLEDPALAYKHREKKTERGKDANATNPLLGQLGVGLTADATQTLLSHSTTPVPSVPSTTATSVTLFSPALPPMLESFSSGSALNRAPTPSEHLLLPDLQTEAYNASSGKRKKVATSSNNITTSTNAATRRSAAEVLNNIRTARSSLLAGASAPWSSNPSVNRDQPLPLTTNESQPQTLAAGALSANATPALGLITLPKAPNTGASQLQPSSAPPLPFTSRNSLLPEFDSPLLQQPFDEHMDSQSARTSLIDFDMSPSRATLRPQLDLMRRLDQRLAANELPARTTSPTSAASNLGSMPGKLSMRAAPMRPASYIQGTSSGVSNSHANTTSASEAVTGLGSGSNSRGFLSGILPRWGKNWNANVPSSGTASSNTGALSNPSTFTVSRGRSPNESSATLSSFLEAFRNASNLTNRTGGESSGEHESKPSSSSSRTGPQLLSATMMKQQIDNYSIALKKWIRKHAKQFLREFKNSSNASPDSASAGPAGTFGTGSSVLTKLEEIASHLASFDSEYVYHLLELARLFTESDVSAFEIEHSGIVEQLIVFLTRDDSKVPGAEASLAWDIDNHNFKLPLELCNYSSARNAGCTNDAKGKSKGGKGGRGRALTSALISHETTSKSGLSYFDHELNNASSSMEYAHSASCCLPTKRTPGLSRAERLRWFLFVFLQNPCRFFDTCAQFAAISSSLAKINSYRTQPENTFDSSLNASAFEPDRGSPQSQNAPPKPPLPINAVTVEMLRQAILESSSPESGCVQHAPFNRMISLLIDYLHYEEQFALQVVEYPRRHTGAGHGSSADNYHSKLPSLRITVARHSTCTNLPPWNGTILAVESTATVSSIEKYLLSKGIGHSISSNPFSSASGPSVANANAGLEQRKESTGRFEKLLFGLSGSSKKEKEKQKANAAAKSLNLLTGSGSVQKKKDKNKEKQALSPFLLDDAQDSIMLDAPLFLKPSKPGAKSKSKPNPTIAAKNKGTGSSSKSKSDTKNKSKASSSSSTGGSKEKPGESAVWSSSLSTKSKNAAATTATVPQTKTELPDFSGRSSDYFDARPFEEDTLDTLDSLQSQQSQGPTDDTKRPYEATSSTKSTAGTSTRSKSSSFSASSSSGELHSKGKGKLKSGRSGKSSALGLMRSAIEESSESSMSSGSESELGEGAIPEESDDELEEGAIAEEAEVADHEELRLGMAPEFAHEMLDDHDLDDDEYGYSDDEYADFEYGFGSPYHDHMRHGRRLELLLGEHVLSPEMNILEAVSRYSHENASDPGSSLSENTLSLQSGIWHREHLITYRAISKNNSKAKEESSSTGSRFGLPSSLFASSSSNPHTQSQPSSAGGSVSRASALDVRNPTTASTKASTRSKHLSFLSIPSGTTTMSGPGSASARPSSVISPSPLGGGAGGGGGGVVKSPRQQPDIKHSTLTIGLPFDDGLHPTPVQNQTQKQSKLEKVGARKHRFSSGSMMTQRISLLESFLGEGLPHELKPLAHRADKTPTSISLETDSISSQSQHGGTLLALSLLRILFALQKHWPLLFKSPGGKPFLGASEMWSTKLVAKANRQLQEPAQLLLGYAPPWLTQICLSCHFLFPFETRYLLFCFVALDRERFSQRLVDTATAHANMQNGALALANSNLGGRLPPSTTAPSGSVLPSSFAASSASASVSVAGSRLPRVPSQAQMGNSTSRPGFIALNDFLMSAASTNGTSANNSAAAGVLTQGIMRLEKHRRSVKRTDLLKQCMKFSDEFANPRYILEFSFEEDKGFGLGPTLEFYTLVSRELQLVEYDLWRNEHAQSKPVAQTPGDICPQYVNAPMGLFPAPLAKVPKVGQLNKIKAKFNFLGRLLARAVMDARLLDMSFSPVFFKWLLGFESTLGPADLELVDRSLARSWWQLEEYLKRRARILLDTNLSAEQKRAGIETLRAEVQALELDMLLPGYGIELCRNARNTPVSLDNLEEYLNAIVQVTLIDGVARQFEALREGFSAVLSLEKLKYFEPEELDTLFAGTHENDQWNVRTLLESCRAEHGFTLDSRALRFLFETMSEFNVKEQRAFLQFVTGSPKLPLGGFRSLNPPLTIVRKLPESSTTGGANAQSSSTTSGEGEADRLLPSVMTCQNYLKLPDYSSKAIMCEKLMLAIHEGQGAFLLS